MSAKARENGVLKLDFAEPNPILSKYSKGECKGKGNVVLNITTIHTINTTHLIISFISYSLNKNPQFVLLYETHTLSLLPKRFVFICDKRERR